LITAVLSIAISPAHKMPPADEIGGSSEEDLKNSGILQIEMPFLLIPAYEQKVIFHSQV
jgi:hypothetical protein